MPHFNKYLFILSLLLSAVYSYGQTWRPIGPVPGPRFINIHAVAEYKGDIIVGGDFTKPIYDFERVARWDGSQWLDMADGIENQFLTIDGSTVYVLESYHDSLYAGGCFWNANRLAYLVRWDDTDWRHFHDSSGTGGCVYTSFRHGDSLFLGGSGGYYWNDLNKSTGMIGLWYKGKMYTMGRGMHSGAKPHKGVKTIAVDDSFVYAGGSFKLFNDPREHHLVKWDGSDWIPMADSINGEVTHIVSYQGSLYVSGRFTKINNDSIAWLARWDGQTWHDVPEIDFQGWLLCSKVYHDVLYLGGHFVGHVGQDSLSCLLGHDGENWFAPAIANADVLDMKIIGDELLMAGGFTKIDSLPVNFLVGLKTIAASNQTAHVIHDLQIYPNPAFQAIYIRFPFDQFRERKITMLDQYGRQLYCNINQSGGITSLDISSLPTGIYYLQVYSMENLFKGTFLKK